MSDGSAKVDLVCDECGKEYQKYPGNINDAENQYCSRECQGKARRLSEDEKASEYSGSAFCPVCDEAFRRRSDLAEHHKEQHFDGTTTDESECPTCGLSFENRRAVSIHHHSTHGESIKQVVSRECENCDEEFEFAPSQLDHRDPKYCSPECHYNHGYGGKGVERVRRILTPEGRHWEEIAREVRENANGECEMCGEETPTHGRPGLQVHHIIPLRSGGTHAEWNLWALCPSCHGKAEAKANEHFKRHLWTDEQCLMDRTRNEMGQFEPIATSTQD